MASAAYKVVFNGSDHFTYKLAGSDQEHPILTFDDAEYWAGEITTGLELANETTIVTVEHLPTSRKTYIATVPTERDRTGAACAWESWTSPNLSAVRSWMARIQLSTAILR